MRSAAAALLLVCNGALEQQVAACYYSCWHMGTASVPPAVGRNGCARQEQAADSVAAAGASCWSLLLLFLPARSTTLNSGAA